MSNYIQPINDNFVLIQTYAAVFLQGNPQVNGTLAPPTGGFIYTVGAVMSVYTAGPNIGQYVNFVSTGTNGQEVAIGICADDNLTFNQMNNGTGIMLVRYGFSQLNANLVTCLTPTDVPIAMAQLGARLIPDVSGIPVYYLP